ncbi:MAG: peptide chain release factor N(5)-glutamine methyltransferase [Chloroflexota bacterium]
MESATQAVAEALVRATARLRKCGSDSARLDAEVLLGDVLGLDRSALATHPRALLGDGHVEAFESHLQRRCDGEPVAYIRGIKEFYGVAIRVDARVLIPRPETETLVALAIERTRDDLTAAPREADAAPYLIWDIGTGSGAIAVAIAAELRKRRYGKSVQFHLSDASTDAIAVAKLNAVSHGVADLMTFARGDLTDVSPAPAKPADLLLANLPYIPSGSMAGLPVAASFEPARALDGGDDGLALVRRLLSGLAAGLGPSGLGLLEIGADQVEGVVDAVGRSLPDWNVAIHPDLSGSPRVVALEQHDG